MAIRPRTGLHLRRRASAGFHAGALRGLLPVVLAVGGLSAPLAPALAATDVGVNVNVVMLNPALQSREVLLLARAQQAGFRHVRMDAYWHWNEPDAPRRITTTTGGLPPLIKGKTVTRVEHDFSWDVTDRLSRKFASTACAGTPSSTAPPRGPRPWSATPTPGRATSPTSPAGLGSSPPATARAARTAADTRSTATRSGTSRTTPTSSARRRTRQYGALFLAAAKAIRAADPAAVVVSGGLAPNGPAGFLDKSIAANPGMFSNIGQVGLHPYGRNVPRVVAHARSMRRFLDRRGLGRRALALNEVGWRGLHAGNDPGELSEATRAGNYALAIDALSHSDCGISSIDAYTLTSPEQDPNYDPEWWGIVRPDGRGARPGWPCPPRWHARACRARRSRSARASRPRSRSC